MEELIISTDVLKLDVPFIHNFLTSSYWAKGRTLEDVELCIRHSLNFGMYLDGRQIGYARVVTDYFQLAYLMDVFVVEEQRGKGYSRQLMQAILEENPLVNMKVWRLATTDAHGLYEKFGFKPLSDPDRFMERVS